MHYTRLLKFKLPLVRGTDVIAVQEQLRRKNFATGEPDGLFGPRTEESVRNFQQSIGLRADGLVGPLTWQRLFDAAEGDLAAANAVDNFTRRLQDTVAELTTQDSRFRNSVPWRLTKTGISIAGAAPVGSGGQPATVTRVVSELRAPLVQWSEAFGVPMELIVATICTESSGKLDIKAREEPGYISDEETPHRVSPGIMQTLISTARAALGNPAIDRAWLEQPANSIQAGTAYIASQWKVTNFDPPKVSCAYNAGGVYYNDGDSNHWKMRQYPIGTSSHADRFVKWFNDCIIVLSAESEPPEMSFSRILKTL